MSQNSESGNGGSGSGTSSYAGHQPSAADKSSTVRDFIYLDEQRLFSYLSQLENGLRLLTQKVQSELAESETKTGGDKDGGEWEIDGGISPTAAALTGVIATALNVGTFPIGMLAGAGFKGKYSHNWETSTDEVKTASNEYSGRNETTVLHHAAFDVVMSRLGDRVKTASGSLTLLPIASLIRSFGNAMQKGLPVDTPDAAGGVAAVGAFEELGTQTVVFLESPENFHAYVQDVHFTLPPSLIYALYGPCSSVEFTIVYIEAQDTRKPRRTIPKQISTPQGKKTFKQLTDVFDGFGQTIGMDDGIRIYPLAIYREI